MPVLYDQCQSCLLINICAISDGDQTLVLTTVRGVDVGTPPPKSTTASRNAKKGSSLPGPNMILFGGALGYQVANGMTMAKYN